MRKSRIDRWARLTHEAVKITQTNFPTNRKSCLYRLPRITETMASYDQQGYHGVSSLRGVFEYLQKILTLGPSEGEQRVQNPSLLTLPHL